MARVQIRETGPGLVRLDHVSGQRDDRAVTIGMLAHSVVRARAPRGPRLQVHDYLSPARRQYNASLRA